MNPKTRDRWLDRLFVYVVIPAVLVAIAIGVWAYMRAESNWAEDCRAHGGHVVTPINEDSPPYCSFDPFEH